MVKGVLLATGNPGKLAEMKKFLAPLPVTSAKELGVQVDVVEDGATLEANAAKKARAHAAVAAERGFAVLADDTGLEIDALGGEPGIKVRRWVGREMTDEEIISHCLSRLAGVPDAKRGAQFRTVLALLEDPAKPDAVTFVDGKLRGSIRQAAVQERWPGKPFQSILHVDEWGMLLGDAGKVSADEKRRRGWLSHRERAMEALRGRIAALTQSEAPAKRPRGGCRNSAFVFLKPAARTPAVKELVRRVLAERGITVGEEGFISAADVDSKQLIDQHYYAIASKALLLPPAEVPVPADRFAEFFGEPWQKALADGRVLRAPEACKHFGYTDQQLDAAWQQAREAGKAVKFGGGFYCARLGDSDNARYAFNGFYMSMRKVYVQPSGGVDWMLCDWDPSLLSFADFRSAVVGDTDPATAALGSLRRTVHDDWQKLGLAAKPWVGDNAVHASASPFEAMAERHNWLQRGELSDDAFAKQLIAAGVAADTLKQWTRDPQVPVPGEQRRQSVFDQLECLDADDCVAAAARISRA